MIATVPTAIIFDRIGSFMQPFVDRAKARGWRVYLAQGEVNLELLNQCDVIYCNWCDHLAVSLAKRRWPGKLVVMVRSYEAYLGFLGAMEWANVDLLVFVSPHIHDYCRLTYPLPPALPVHFVPDCVDLDRFPLKADLAPGNRVAFVGRLGAPKCPEFLVAAAYEFPAYEFCFKGPFEDRRLQAFFALHASRAGNIHVDGPTGDGPWFSGAGVNDFLENCHYIASPSFHEGTHMALLEGMAKGLCPLVQERPGAVVEPEYSTYRSMCQFGALLTAGAPSADHRLWVKEHRDLPRQVAAIDAMFELVAPSPIIMPPKGRLN